MSRADQVTRGGLPRFDLAYLYDNPLDPGEVTVFEPDSGTVATAWITVDAAHAVPLERVA